MVARSENENVPLSREVRCAELFSCTWERDSIVEEGYVYRGALNGRPCKILVDTGAQLNFVCEKLVKIPGQGYGNFVKRPVKITTADSSTMSQGYVKADLEIYSSTGNYVSRQCGFQILSKIPYDVILGIPWIKSEKANLTHQFGLSLGDGTRLENDVYGPTRLITRNEFTDDMNRKQYESLCLVNIREFNEENAQGVEEPACCVLNACEQDPDATKALDILLHDFDDVLVDELPEGVSEKVDFSHKIDLIDPEAKPPCAPVRRMSPAELTELKHQLKLLSEKKFIKPSKGPYGSPVLFAKKKDGSYRMCIDYRALNSLTKKNRYPLPQIDTILDAIQDAKYFSSLDLVSGYWQIPMDEKSVEKTAFRCQYGSYEFRVMPFGLTNAPSTFQALMNEIFEDCLNDFVVVYLDDILVFSRNREEHAKHLQIVLKRLKKRGLKVKKSKCKFFQKQLKFLGYEVSEKGVAVDEDKVKAILDIEQPKNLKELRSFLGSTNYYRKFIKEYALIASPLTELLKQTNPFIWSTACEDAFQKLKQSLIQPPVLATLDPGKPFVVHTDASDVAVGAVLMQKHDEGLRPLAYFSKKLGEREMNYPTHDKELLAIMHVLRVWKHYLLGVEFDLYTDCGALSVLSKPRSELNKRQLRSLETLEEFHGMTMHHIAGKENSVADALSRMPTKQILTLRLANTTKAESEEILKNILFAPFVTTVQELLKTDKFALQIMALLENPDRSTLLPGYNYKIEDFTITNGIILYQGRVYLPESYLREILIAQNHDTAIAGHMGRDKTYELVKRYFFWPGLSQDVDNYVRTCPKCQAYKPSNRAELGLLAPLPIPKGRWDSVSLDFITNLPLTSRGHTVAVVFVDRFTKMICVEPMPTRFTAQDVAYKYFTAVFRLHGMPKSFVSDRDVRFMSTFWQELHALVDTRLLMSTSYHPQTDGQTERANRTIKQYLKMYCEDSPEDWDLYLTAAEFAYNNSENASTKMTPFFMNYGRHPRTPATYEGGLPDTSESYEVTEFVTRLKEHMLLARDRLLKAQSHQKTQADKHKRQHDFKVGDKVWVAKTKREKTKFGSIMKGPYEILELIGDNAIKVRHTTDHATDTVNISRVRTYEQREEMMQNSTLVQHEVHAFKAKKEHKGETSYLVSYKQTAPADEWYTEKELLRILGPDQVAAHTYGL